MRAMTSAKLMPAAATSIRTSPAPRGGSGRSSTASTLGGPCLVITTARTRAAYRSRAAGRRVGLAQVDGPAVAETLRGDDLLDDLGGDERVGRDDHRGETPAVLGVAPVGRVTDGGGGDVDAVPAERGADAADHAGHVGVAEYGDE